MVEIYHLESFQYGPEYSPVADNSDDSIIAFQQHTGGTVEKLFCFTAEELATQETARKSCLAALDTGKDLTVELRKSYEVSLSAQGLMDLFDALYNQAQKSEGAK